MNDCIEWQGYKSRQGYGRTTHNGESWRIHRLVWTKAYGEIPAGMSICHSCDNPACVNIQHLWLGSDADNVHDRDRKGRQYTPRGSSNGSSVLNETKVLEIRRMRTETALSCPKLAQVFGVNKTTIQRIINRKRWQHI